MEKERELSWEEIANKMNKESLQEGLFYDRDLMRKLLDLMSAYELTLDEMLSALRKALIAKMEANRAESLHSRDKQNAIAEYYEKELKKTQP